LNGIVNWVSSEGSREWGLRFWAWHGYHGGFTAVGADEGLNWIGDDLAESKGTAGAGLGDGLIMFCRLEFE
jgi:hypothetical protein